MIIEGTYTLQASPEDVSQCLVDRQILLETIPGIEQLERVKKDSYAVAITIKQVPLKGTYHGLVTVSEQQHPYHYHLTMEAEGRQHSISGNGNIHLNESENQTVIAYTGTLTIGKFPALVSKGAAKLLIQHFFTALADRVRENALLRHTKTEEIADTIKRPGGSIIVLPPPSTEDIPLSLKIARWFKLGEGDSEQEALWAKRVQQLSILSGLLFLVWVGTRLPRRK